jgi:mevalonate kinase
MAKGRACGKIILLGEHFVVSHDEGAPATPALAVPLPELWCEVRITPNHHPHYKAELPAGGEAPEIIESLMARAAHAAADSMRVDIKAQPLRFESSANFPVSRGLGSSAAFAVALARAFDDYRRGLVGVGAEWQELVRAAYSVERVFHGRPSGLDTAVILAERPVRFQGGNVVREFVNTAVDLVVVDSGDRDDCATLIRGVSAFREREPSSWARMSEAVTGAVDRCEKALREGDAATVGACVTETHAILSELGLSNSTIDGIVADARQFGALAGKVSGAGGGGAVLLVARSGEGKALAHGMRETGRAVVAVDFAAGGANAR